MEEKKPTIFTQKGHAVGTVAPSGMAHTPMRDISNCLVHIMNNAIIMTQDGIGEDEEKLEHLGSIVMSLGSMYASSRVDNTNWLTGFEELYEYLETYDSAPEVYGNFCCNFVMNIFSYLFTSTQMGFKTGETIEKDDGIKILFTSLMSVMDDKAKTEVTKALSTLGNKDCVPDLTTLIGGSRKYIEQVREAQAKQKKDKNN